jgi:hypothetical protein
MTKWTKDYDGYNVVDIPEDIEWEIEHGAVLDGVPAIHGLFLGHLRVTLEWIPEEQP